MQETSYFMYRKVHFIHEKRYFMYEKSSFDTWEKLFHVWENSFHVRNKLFHAWKRYFMYDNVFLFYVIVKTAKNSSKLPVYRAFSDWDKTV